MQKTFSEILENAPWFSEEQAQQLLQWAGQYPYSQVLQVAVACAAWRFNWPDKQEWLQRAAVYSANRSVLKSWIEKAQQEEPVNVIPAEIPSSESDLAEAVIADIKSLHESMKRFESIVQQNPESYGVRPQATKAGKTGKSKKERLLAAVRQLQEEQAATTAAPAEEERPKKKSRGKRKSETDTILKEIESRQQVESGNNKTREQLEIIERFIQSNPSISPQPGKTENEPATDLTTPQPDFSEHIVSETLVEILLQQGKKDKAIEVLKKLIWKFPQKKTYFAARIDDLKK